MSTVINALVEWFGNTLSEVLQALVMLIADMSDAFPYWEQDWATNSRAVIYTIAWSWLCIRVVYESWRLYIAREAGDAIVSPALLIRRAITACIAIPATGWAITWLAQLASLSSDALASMGVTVDLFAWGSSLVSALITTALGLGFGTLLVYVVMLGALLILMVLVYLQAFVRGVELAIAFIIGPICAVSAAGTDEPLASGALGYWVREVFVLHMTGTIQTAMLIGVVQYTLGTGFEIISVMTAVPIMYVALRAPVLLRNYVYTMGGGSSGQGGNTILMMAAKAAAQAPW